MAAVFDAQPPAMRAHLLRLRAWVYAVAAETDGVGTLVETLKWGQPSYLTQRPRSGTTLRIAPVTDDPSGYGLYVHCQSRVVEAARAAGLHMLTFEGTRAVRLTVGEPVPEAAVRQFIRLALTYHQWKSSLR